MTADQIRRIASSAGKAAYEAGPKHEAVARALSVGHGGEPGLFLADGLWLNSQAVAYGAGMQALYVCPELLYSEEWVRNVEEMISCAAEVFILSEKVYGRIGDEKGDRGVLSILRLPEWSLDGIPDTDRSTVLVLDGLENPGNMGTLIRTAEGAGADAVIVCNKRTGLNNRMVVRASLLTLLTLPVVEAGAGECMQFLSRRGYTIYLGKSGSAVHYCDIGYAQKAAVVLGHEKYGVSDSWFSRPHIAVSIPMLGRVDSLNVAVAGGILLYEAARSRGVF